MIKKLGLIMSMVSVLVVTVQADGKRYEIESGKIEYKSTTSGAVMGIKTTGEGSARLLFKDYGNLELNEENSSTTTMGQTTKNHQMMKIEKGKLYSVDFEQKKILTMDNLMQGGQNQNMVTMGKEMMQSMGGQKIGEEKFKNYECEVWSVMGSKVWLHKGVMLKVEADVMGIKTVKEATAIAFDVKLDDEMFALPKFEKESIESIMNQQMEGAVGGVDEPEQAPTQKQLDQVRKQLEEAMKNFGGMPQQ
jgi:hypothetical protein